MAQVHAALAYYHANRDEFEAAITAEEAEADGLGSRPVLTRSVSKYALAAEAHRSQIC